ncbi:MAG: hypothetical protein GC160_04315 [Acidobacteria bacterium]|nr:hypothetical protein [Acidobacteriota bacterium]
MKLTLSGLQQREALVVRSMLRVLEGMLDDQWDVDDERFDLAFFDPEAPGYRAFDCDHKVALVSRGRAAPPGVAALVRPARISQLRSILNEVAEKRRQSEPPLLRSGSIRELDVGLRRLLSDPASPHELFIQIDDVEAALDSKRDVCRWRSSPERLEELRERLNLDIRVVALQAGVPWAPFQVSPLDSFLDRLHERPDPSARRPATDSSWRRALSHLSVLQRIRVRLGLAS